MQGRQTLKDSEGYRSVQKQNIREMLKGKGIGEREASRTLQGKGHLGLVQAQHKESGVCKQLQKWWPGFHLLPVAHNAALASLHMRQTGSEKFL